MLRLVFIFISLIFTSITKAETPEDIAIMAVHQAIRVNHLTSLRDPCLAYDYDDFSDKNYFLVSVRENKRYTICGGDPATSIQLFHFKVDRKNYSLETDAGGDEGIFHPIKYKGSRE